MKTMWKVVRRPMTRWWLRNGSWWLVGIVLVNIAYCYLFANISISAPRLPMYVFHLLYGAHYFLPLALFVVAASVCDGIVFRSYEEQAAPKHQEILWARYMLALGQVIPIAVVSISVAIWKNYYIQEYGSFSTDNSESFWVVSSAFEEFTSVAVLGFWLILFVVLGAKTHLQKFGLFYAYMLSTVMNTAIVSNRNMNWDNDGSPFTYEYSGSVFLFLVAVPLWLLLAYSLKENKRRLANALQTIMVVSIIGNMSLIMLYEQFGWSLLKGLAFATETINSALYYHPQFAAPITGLPGSNLDPQETVLGYLPFLLTPILAWLRPCFLLGVIYLFVFSSYPKAWVAYCWEKQSSSR